MTPSVLWIYKRPDASPHPPLYIHHPQLTLHEPVTRLGVVRVLEYRVDMN